MILNAYGAAVRETLSWAEKNLAETRMEARGSEWVVRTGNLVAAVFQHDTNRNQEPNAHFHAVIANITQGPDGKPRNRVAPFVADAVTFAGRRVRTLFAKSVQESIYS